MFTALNIRGATTDQRRMANPIATGNITRSSGTLPHRQQRGLTLIECVIAMFVLLTATVGILTTTVAGHGHLAHADQRLLAIRLAEQLIEEIVARPYTGGGASRADWSVDGYDGFFEAPGNLEDATGAACGAEEQVFSRLVTISAGTRTVAGLSVAATSGVTIDVTVTAPDAKAWSLQRFVPEPYWP